MGRAVGMAVVAFLLCSWARPTAAEVYEEAWRSPFGHGRSVSVNTNDGSCWAATGSSIMHIAADGTVLSQTNGFWNPNSVSVYPADGSCWVVDSEHDELVHLSASGQELSRQAGFSWHSLGTPILSWGAVAVNAADGSCRVADLNHGQVVSVSASGAELWRSTSLEWPESVSVDPNDGSCWVVDGTYDYPDVVHLSATGQELWRGRAFQYAVAVAVNPVDSSCWIVDAGRSEDPDVMDGELVHLSADGQVLWRGGRLCGPGAVAVNSTDGSCWVADYESEQVVHFSASGQELGRGGNFWQFPQLAVDPGDGSVWVSHMLGVVHLAATLEELWRGDPIFPVAVAVNSVDGTCWVADGPMQSSGYTEIVHLAADGNELWRGEGSEHLVQALAVNSADGSCWFAGYGSENSAMGAAHVLHLSESGERLLRGGGLNCVTSLTVNPTDGTVWVGGQGDAYTVPYLLHIAPEGAVLWSYLRVFSPASLSVNPADGSCWVADAGSWDFSLGLSRGEAIYHFAEDGAELWRSETLGAPTSVSVSPSDGSCWVGFDYRTLHLSASGDEMALGEAIGVESPAPSTNPSDGSCWVVDGDGGQLAHLSARGRERWRGGGFYSPIRAAPSPADGSVWVADTANGQVVRLVAALSAAFRGTPLIEVTPVEVAFTDLSIGATAWRWDFGDGSSSEEQHPTHRFERIGSHQISLTITGARGSDTEIKPHYVLVSFPDVPPGFWSLRQILACVDAGVVQGYEDGLYRPLEAVTRGQMAAYIARASAGGDQFVPTGPAEATFPDVPNSGYGEDGAEAHWAYKYVEYCAGADIVGGYDDGSYRPDEVVDRGQMAVYIARAHAHGDANVPEDDGVPSFPDVPMYSTWQWCYRYVEYCAANGLVRGYSDGYHPEYQVTRDQMAVYVQRAFGLAI